MPQLRTFCRVCEPACGLVARSRTVDLTAVRPDREHPISRGWACNKGLATSRSTTTPIGSTGR